MNKASTEVDTQQEYVSHHVMEPGPLADRKLTGTWKDYVTVTKLGIIIGNLLTVFTGMWLASAATGHSLDGVTILCTLLGAALIIASGTCLNNYLDRDIDQKMQRTKKRALAQGRLDSKSVLTMGFVFAILGTTLLLPMGYLATLVALFGLFGYVVLYTLWLKRTHELNTVVGSVAGAVPPMIGWAAVAKSLDPGAWVLFSIMFVWQIPHFLAIAIRRYEDYKNAGIPMLPVVRGFRDTKWQMLNYTAGLIPVSLLLPLSVSMSSAYVWLALILGIAWLVLSVKGFFTKGHEETIDWAKKYFIYSLVYLVLLFTSMIVLVN
ncbi:heme o synthase [Caldalkalibacillus salinus]|uniref:heme o synthase n=1 Tax=Caldalkalibacillus salinus TaxID=2803787 RepID=UPI001924F481|nr:heme o synthase [Caldalkalibacillus salinus]